MTGSARRRVTPIAILFSLALALLLFATTGVSQAQAADYSVSDWGECGGGYNAGSFDKNGNLYVPCSAPGSANFSESTIYKVAEDGTRTAVSAPLGFHVTDVAPSPTGDFLYATVAEKVTDPNRWDNAKNAVRLKKELDGKYVKDTGFTFKNYGFEGSSLPPHGMHIATDAHADGTHNIYLSSGAWTLNGSHTVVKYKSNGDWAGVTIGKYVPKAEKDLASSWDLGRNYHNLTGLAVSLDGNRVYTTEVGNNRVQRWTKPEGSSETTAYTVDKSFGGQYKAGAQDPHIQRQAHCEQVGWSADSTFSAPYDVALTNEGGTEYLYVLNTTCQQVLKFNAAQAFNGGTEGFVDTAQLGAAAASTLPHGFAVSSKGNVFAGQARKMWTQPDDSVAPTISLTAPTDGATVSGTSVTLSADASDDKGVSRVDFYVGTTKVGSDSTAGGTSGKEYSYTWDSTSVSDGTQTITARAYDAANKETISSSRTVTVKNTSTPPGEGTCKDEAATNTGSNDPAVKDNLVGLAGRDVIDARRGNDTISTLNNTDVACGGDGYDTFTKFSGSSQIDGGDETGDPDADEADFSWITQPDANGRGAYVAISGISDGSGFEVTMTEVENAKGSPFTDSMYGDDQRNEIHGGAGNDFIKGGAEAAGAKGDLIHGEAGDDTIDVRDGSIDTVNCGDGDGDNDKVIADPQGTDTINPDCEIVEFPDATAPTVKSLVATNKTTAGVPLRKTNFKATFSEKMTNTTLNKTTFKLYKCTSTACSTTATSATVTPSADGLSATLNPFGTTSSLLAANTKYKVVVTTGAKDAAGNALDQNSSTAGNQQKVSYFKTGSS